MATLCLGLWLGGAAQARSIIDMAGRQVEVPAAITKVYATAPPATWMVHALGPDLLAGLNRPLPREGRRFLDPRTVRLPVLGGWFGQGRMANLESLLQLRPQVVVAFRWQGRSVPWKIEQTLEPLGLPVVSMVISGLDDFPAVFRFLGRLCNRPQRAQALAVHAEQTLASLARLRDGLPREQRPVVYYAEGPQGLQTECHSSFHAELIQLCGGINPHRCLARTIYGMDKISLEQVLAYDPQVILVQDPRFYKAVFQDPRWRRVRAVARGGVYLIPSLPLNWFDRPPSFMRLLGAHWLAAKLHPQRHPVDLAAKTVEFFKLFLGVELDPATARQLLGP